MTDSVPPPDRSPRFIAQSDLQRLIDALIGLGYRVVGPTIDQGAIVYDEIESVDDLPRGWTDEQEPGKYRLVARDDEALFGYVVGPHSWKRFLFPPQAIVATADRTADGWQMQTPDEAPPRYAFLGVRACELAAIARAGPRVSGRRLRRSDLSRPSRRPAASSPSIARRRPAPAFARRWGPARACTAGFDLALTEIDDGFIGRSRQRRWARDLSARLPSRPPADRRNCKRPKTRGSRPSTRSRAASTPTDIRDLLLSNLDHPRWNDVATRCLSCTNCTMVCPTCFCSSVEEVTDLTATTSSGERQWDSCFNLDFSYMNGGVVRNQIRSRYRQWLTHKLASWIDQFGTSGCVGCGRCITWCPVGIDLTEEVAAIRGEPA